MSERYQLRQGKLRPHPTGEWVPHFDVEQDMDLLRRECEQAEEVARQLEVKAGLVADLLEACKAMVEAVTCGVPAIVDVARRYAEAAIAKAEPARRARIAGDCQCMGPEVPHTGICRICQKPKRK